jgi:uncharacterized protein
MKFLRTLQSLALSALMGSAMVATGCVDQGTSETQAVVEQLSDTVMPNAPEAPGEFQVARTPDGQWFFNVIGARGEILLTSQSYAQESSAINGVLSVEENGIDVTRYSITGADESWTFTLKAKNGQTIADGAQFRDADEAEEGVIAARELVAGILQHRAAVLHGARFDLYRGPSDSKWYFSLKTADDRVLLDSQAYSGRTAAVTGLQSVRTNGKDSVRYRITGTEPELYLVLKAANGKEIASSGPHASAEAAQAIQDEAIELLKSERVGSPW